METRIRKLQKAHLFLEEHMKPLGLSQADLARKTGENPKNISLWVRNRQRPSNPDLAKLAQALNTTPDGLWRAPARPERPSLDAILEGLPDSFVHKLVEAFEIIKKWAVCIALSSSLLGCATAAEQAQIDDAKCQSYGSHSGDPAYVQCRAQLDAARTIAANEAAATIPIARPQTNGGLWHPGQF